MSKFEEFWKLAGERNTRPSLKEARESATDEEVGSAPTRLIGDGKRAVELAEAGAIKEMKLGLASASRNPPNETGLVDPKAPFKKKQPQLAPAKQNKGKARLSPVPNYESADTPDEAAHRTKKDSGDFETKHSKQDKADQEHYYKLSGEAHFHSHQAHELSKMVDSGELPDAHHAAHDAHDKAIKAHKAADAHLAKTSLATPGRSLHKGAIYSHEKHLVRHGKKIGKY